ncbi:MAG: hypothetical protein ACRC68_09000 [Clostridium sp.]
MIKIKYANKSKNNKFIFWLQMVILVIMNIFFLLILDDFTHNKIKFTLLSLCIFTSIVVTIISIIVFFRSTKSELRKEQS